MQEPTHIRRGGTGEIEILQKVGTNKSVILERAGVDPQLECSLSIVRATEKKSRLELLIAF